MRPRIVRFVPGVLAGLLAAVAPVFLPASGVSAAEECIAAPTSKTTPGGRWYYRTDRDNNRKCWFLAEPGSLTPRAEAPRAQPSAEANPKPKLSYFISLLAAPFTRSNPGGTQQARAKGDASMMQTTRPNAPGNTERRTRVASRPDANAILGGKQHRRSSTQLEYADEQRPAPLRNQAEQDALFQEFLRWKQRQTP